jgi:hypothetical protein
LLLIRSLVFPLLNTSSSLQTNPYSCYRAPQPSNTPEPSLVSEGLGAKIE